LEISSSVLSTLEFGVGFVTIALGTCCRSLFFSTIMTRWLEMVEPPSESVTNRFKEGEDGHEDDGPPLLSTFFPCTGTGCFLGMTFCLTGVEERVFFLTTGLTGFFGFGLTVGLSQLNGMPKLDFFAVEVTSLGFDAATFFALFAALDAGGAEGALFIVLFSCENSVTAAGGLF
jgi:hypothetical protein